jgi:hypothetical protein
MTAIPKFYGTPNKLLEEIQDLATKDTAKYFFEQTKMPEFIPGETPETIETMDAAKAKLRKEIVDEVIVDGYVAEFGVDKGKSFTQLCSLFPNDTVYGFDAFKGLPEGGKWHGNTIHKGMFDNHGKPPFVIPANGEITNGWFDDTLHEFDIAKTQPAKYLHIDCDVYSSTRTILEILNESIVKGTIIVFDDYCNYTGWRQGEWKAWQQFVKVTGIAYTYIYVAGMAVGVKVTYR